MDPVVQNSSSKFAIDVGKGDELPFPLLMVGALHFPFDESTAAPYVEVFRYLIHASIQVNV